MKKNEIRNHESIEDFTQMKRLIEYEGLKSNRNISSHAKTMIMFHKIKKNEEVRNHERSENGKVLSFNNFSFSTPRERET